MAEGNLGDLINLNTVTELRELVEFLKASGVTQFDIEQPNLKLRLKFTGPETAAGVSAVDLASLSRIMAVGSAASAPHAAETEHLASASAPVAALPATPTAEPVDENAGLHIVRSPLVGTFYDAPSPGAEGFVKVGDRVDTGKVLCIVEAMKIMNEIESDASGEVAKVFTKPGQPVEYGQPLFGLRP